MVKNLIPVNKEWISDNVITMGIIHNDDLKMIWILLFSGK